MLTARQTIAYADFFARLPAAIAYVSVMSFWIEWLQQKGHQ